jgi:hypothetical protein
MTRCRSRAFVTRYLMVFALCTMSFGLASAQTSTATLSGTVLDPNGAVVPGANITVTEIATGLQRTATTNDQGSFTIPLLKPSIYLLQVEHQGFLTAEVRDITLNVGDERSLRIQMKVGDVKETVNITAETPLINESTAVSTVVDQTYVKNMPLNGRSFQTLILLTPGVITNSPQVRSSTGFSGEFSVNGQRTESNNYTVDGVSANIGVSSAASVITGAGVSGSVPASTALGTTQALVSVDDLQEFRVQSSSYSAEYGRNPGGQFSFETKSGTNQWHGTAYEYLRNDVFDANDWFNNYFGRAKPPLRQNDFGGTFGGPVMLPRFGEGGRQPGYNGRNRTFFFFNYEGLRLLQPQAAAASFVPDAALRLSAPPALQQVLNAFPVQSPNGIDDTVNGVAQFIGTWSNPASLNSTSIRFDHAINDKLRLFFRFSDTKSRSTTLGTVQQALTPATANTSAYRMRAYTAGASSVFSSRVSNEFRFNFSSNRLTTTQTTNAIGGNTPVSLSQLAGLGPEGQVGVILLLGGNNIQLVESGQLSEQKQWNLVDTVGFSLGRHQFKFGVDYRRLAPIALQPNPQAAYVYLSKAQVQANSLTTRFRAKGPAYPLYTNFSAFAQDEWRASKRLSLSLGLRWEVNPPPGVTQGLMPYTVQGSSLATLTLAPQGTPLWQTTWFNFAPRLGVAYILNNRQGRETVVRGGGGVFFDTGQQLGSLSFTGPGFTSGLVAVPSASFPTPVVFPLIVNPPVAPFGAVDGFASHLQLPYTLQWNASIEQAFGKSQTFSASYIGSHAARLLQLNVLIPTNNPNITNIQFVGNGLTSDYDALQGQFQRRLSRGLTALASYTWSHCLDYGSENFVFTYQRGNCDFDVRHNLSAAFSYDLPRLGHGSFVKAVMNHWGLDGRFIARTAFPITLNGNTLIDPTTLQQFHAGLNFVPNQPVYLYGDNCATVLQGLHGLQPGQTCPGGRAINPLAFSNVSSGLGNAPRNFARGFGAWQMDLALRREFPIYENLKLQFRAEAFNVFNHPNFGVINSSFGTSTFGQATATLASSLGVLGPLYQSGGPRSMQFSVKLIF